MRKSLIWFAFLTKRLYKKVTFICILLLIPLVVVAFDHAAQSETGIVTVLLACQDPQDTTAQAVIEDLTNEPGVILFRQCDAESAREQVLAGEADTAWIFPKDMEKKLVAFSLSGGVGDGVVQIIERESTVAVRLAREKLSAAIYGQCAKYVYLRYVHDNVPESEEIPDEVLLEYLSQTNVQGELFAFYDISGNERSDDANYLTAPVRGLLAVLVAVSAMITAMFYQKDLERGMFALLTERSRIFNEFLYQIVSSLNLMAAVFVALVVSGLAGNIWLELLWMVTYSLCCAVFGVTLRWLFGGKLWMAALLPAAAIVMLAVCPVFFDLPQLHAIQRMLPPTYFIQGVYDLTMLIHCGIFVLCMLVLCALRGCLQYVIGVRLRGKIE